MLRGSKPGEHRGGRKPHTPNRRTILVDRILSIGSEHPRLLPHGFLLRLVKDPKLPADTRMALAPKSFPLKRIHESRTRRQGAAPVSVPQEWTPLTLDALFGIVQDATADAKARRKAALKIAEFLLPKVAKKAKVLPDEYGFLVNPNLASAYRDIQLELQALVTGPSGKIPAIAEKIKKLEARSDAIRRRLQVPCPTKYTNNEAADDHARLLQYASLRDDKFPLTETQKAEEAHRKVRFDVFAYSPESNARRRREALQEAERRFERNRGIGGATPLSGAERKELELLRWLYPKPTVDRAQLDDTIEIEMHHDHPFRDEYSDGNYYPQLSKVRPVGVTAVSWSDGSPFSPVCPGNAAATDPIPSVEAEKLC
jgi:hypothetical protein